MKVMMKPVFCVSLLFLFAFFEDIHCQTCQCIQQSDLPLNCIGYDSKLQAETLEEAIASFPDLSLDNSDQNDSDVDCMTQQCQDCRQDMQVQLQRVGLITNLTSPLKPTSGNSTCTKYRFSQEAKQREAEEDDDSSSSDSSEDTSKHREKREVTDANLIGERFTISCAVKGVNTDPTGTVSLCSSCWVWRRLPENYSPQFVNELVCDSTDDSCLSGYAQCSIGHRTFEAVRNDGGVLTKVTLTAGSYCECRISTDSSLQSLVTGSGISGTYSPIIQNNINNNTIV